MPSDVVLRHPSRRWAAAVLLPFLVVLLIGLPALSGLSGPWKAICVVVLSVCIVGCGRIVFRAGVRADADALVIHDILWTRRIAWTDIDDFVVRTTGTRRGVFVLLGDGREVGLDAAMPSYQLGNRTEYFERCRAQLRSWLDESHVRDRRS